MRTALIIGAGPAGLTAAYELVRRTGILPVVLEGDSCVGGIARTLEYHGNRMDIGGHRFFSKSDRVMKWWLDILPLQRLPEGSRTVTYHGRSAVVEGSAEGPDPEREDRVMLVRRRRSRIYFRRRFFDYPIRLTPATLAGLGAGRSLRIALSYAASVASPIREERTLEDFFVNRFGRELYRTFFESYTEKVWGVPCREISAAWGAQRVKGLSVSRALAHFARGLLPRGGDLSQRGTETSLIEYFLYPKYGPGQMWEEVKARVEARGGRVLHRHRVTRLLTEGNTVRAVKAAGPDGREVEFAGDWFFSSMPVSDLVRALEPSPPDDVAEVAAGLKYRDFITVGLLLKKLRVEEPGGGLLRDNWIYIQEPDVKMGRMQIFNNWSPYLVRDPGTVWVGLEYFCFEGDALWNRSDADLTALAAEELERIGLASRADVLDGVVLRVPKTYPAYFGSYGRFDVIRRHTDRLANLFLIGRNGMHRYNNQDHSMLTAMTAVDNILDGRADKANLWEVNTEEDYHEER